MDFRNSKLPSSLSDLEYHWKLCVVENINYKCIKIDNIEVDFTKPVDFFDITDECADEISYSGRRYDLFYPEVDLEAFELNVFGDISPDTQIGGLLSNITQKRPYAVPYCIYAVFEYINNSVYCAFTVGIADDDTGLELEIAVVEIGHDEGPYILPVAINEECLHYYSFDDIMKVSFWLANFWVGIQNKLNNCREEIRIVEQRNPQEVVDIDALKEENRTVLVRKVVYIDEDANIIKSENAGTKRKYQCPSWGVRGHSRTLKDGRITHVKPHKRGKERKNPESLVKKEYLLDGHDNN